MSGLAAIDGVAEVRGRGLMVGLTLADGLDAPAARDRCLDAGLVLNCPGPGDAATAAAADREWRGRGRGAGHHPGRYQRRMTQAVR